MANLQVFNPGTGEVIDTTGKRVFILHENSIKAYHEKEYRKKYVRTEIDKWHAQNGTYYTFSIKESVKTLFKGGKDFTDSEKVHVMYVGSYVGYDGRLMNGTQAMTKKSTSEENKYPTRSGPLHIL
jgi:hypothetical protein